MSRTDIIVRISGKGQFKINSDILDKINEIDNSIVTLIENYSREARDHKTTQKDLSTRKIDPNDSFNNIKWTTIGC
jgi:archaellum component FlaC